MSDPIKKARTIHLAHGDADQLAILRAILEAIGHKLPLVTESGAQLIEKSIEDSPDLIVASPRLSDMDGIEALIKISEEKPTAGIVIAGSDDLDRVERAMEDHVMAYLVEPVTIETMQPAVFLAERRFEHFQGMTKKIERLETLLEERKVIERAKGIIMQIRCISEEEAHRYLQSHATRSRQKLAELATSICEAGDVLQPQSGKSHQDRVNGPPPDFGSSDAASGTNQ